MAIHELKVSVCTECEEYKELRMNGCLVLEGDYYHDKISYKIDGFILGVKEMGHEVIMLEEDVIICDDCDDSEEEDTMFDFEDDEVF